MGAQGSRLKSRLWDRPLPKPLSSSVSSSVKCLHCLLTQLFQGSTQKFYQFAPSMGHSAKSILFLIHLLIFTAS